MFTMILMMMAMMHKGIDSLKYRHGHQQHRGAVLLGTVPILKRQSKCMLLCIMNIIMRVIVNMMLIMNIIINIMMMTTTFFPSAA